MTKVVTNQWRLSRSRAFVDSISDRSRRVYAFVSDSSQGNDSPSVTSSLQDIFFKSRREMMYGSRVTPQRVSIVARLVEYEANTVYSQYDDQDPLLSTRDFYVCLPSGDVFKCLQNAGGAPSLVAPDRSDVDETDEAYFTSDGYQWKYMFSYDPSELVLDVIDGYFPVTTDPNVASYAVSGAVDVIKVTAPGAGYDNYLEGTFAASDLRVGGNTRLYSLSGVVSSGVNGYYTNCYLTLTSGTGSGQFREITSYVSNSSGRFVGIDSEFTQPPTNGTEWSIDPVVRIKGTGQTITAAARAIVNSTGNTIASVEMLRRGEGYSFATATVESNPVVGVDSQAEVRVIVSPQGGHGSDAESELFATSVVLTVSFGNTSFIPVSGSFKRVGLIENPLFSNVQVYMSSVRGDFISGERIVNVSTRRLPGQVSVNSASAVITGNATFFSESVSVGDKVYLTTGVDDQVAVINSVANDSSATLSSNSSWSSDTADVYLVTELASMVATSSNTSTNVVTVDSLSGDLLTGDVIVGETSGARGVVDYVSRSGEQKNTSTFISLSRIDYSATTGTPTVGETLYQGGSLSTASVTATLVSLNSSVAYVSNVVGSIVAGQPMFGSTSGSVLNVSNKYGSEVEFDSGVITFLENVPRVQRSPDQSETIKFLVEF